MIRQCLVCGKDIECYPSTYDKKKYCSKECKESTFLIEVECIQCGDKYQVAQSRYNAPGLEHKCCSKECYILYKADEKVAIDLNNTYTCTNCNIEFTSVRNNKTDMKFCSQKCSTEYLRGEQSPFWNSGTVTMQGYKAVKVGDKYVLEHRLIMETHLGRKLEPREQVHHLDGDKLNNDISNLDIIDISEHGRIHAMERWHGNGEE